jgi:hypothetical protein
LKKIKIISFVLALLMMVQMMPIPQIGKLLSTNQWTEELPHSCEESSSKGDAALNSTFIPPDQHMLVSMFCDASTLIFLHLCSQIPFNQAADIVSPPPDFA